MIELAAGGASARVGGAVSSYRSLQLDVFRALAAIFMIVNHAGNQLLWRGGDGYWPSFLVFIGSAAPALFFLATGVGSGLSPGRGEAVGSMLHKVVLLFLADMLLNWSSGNPLQFDFFGFAAVTTLVLFLVRRSRRPSVLALLLLAIILGVRFGLVAFVRGTIPADSIAAFLTGIEPVHGVSYPLAPWLAFPLMGFLAGRRWRQGVTMDELCVISLLSVLGLGTSATLAERGAPVFRWGSVSIAYFLCAVGIIAASWLLSSASARWLPSLSGAMALRGAASLLIVPVHYGIIGVLAELDPSLWNPATWLATTVLLAGVVLLTCRAVITRVSRLAVPGLPAQVVIAAAACAVAFAALLLASPLVRLELCSFGEMVIGALLLWSGKATTHNAAMDLRCRSDGLP